MQDVDEQFIQEQIEYYRRKAPDYDETAAQADDLLVAYGAQIDAALDAFRPSGHVLEIACGTGNGTRRLLKYAAEVTALDSSPETLERARKKLGDDPRVSFIEADVFAWEPDDRYDVAYFRSWLTHVPLDRFDRFWDLVRRALKPGGRVFFEDDMEGAFEEERVAHPSVPFVRRSAGDGDSYRVVKVFWKPAVLESRLRELDWDIKIHTAGPLFWGEGRRGAG